MPTTMFSTSPTFTGAATITPVGRGLANDAYYYLGKMYFNDNKFRDAQQTLQKVRPSRLSNASRDEYYFMLGYSSLRNDDARTAKNYFSRVSDRNESLYGQAYYYLGHINFLEGNDQEALAVGDRDWLEGLLPAGRSARTTLTPLDEPSAVAEGVRAAGLLDRCARVRARARGAGAVAEVTCSGSARLRPRDGPPCG